MSVCAQRLPMCDVERAQFPRRVRYFFFLKLTHTHAQQKEADAIELRTRVKLHETNTHTHKREQSIRMSSRSTEAAFTRFGEWGSQSGCGQTRMEERWEWPNREMSSHGTRRRANRFCRFRLTLPRTCAASLISLSTRGVDKGKMATWHAKSKGRENGD